MNLIQEWGYTVRLGMEAEHQQWLIDNDASIRAGTPAGMTYLGTFAVVFSSEKTAGGYRMLYELDDYAALDAGAAANKDPEHPWGKFAREWSRFVDFDLAAPWSSGLLRNVVEATIWDPVTD